MTEAADFADFVERRSGALLRAAWLLTSGDWALAEDLAQTALGEVWRRWDRVAGMDAPEAYAHKILVNTSLRWRGRRWTGEIASAEASRVRSPLWRIPAGGRPGVAAPRAARTDREAAGGHHAALLRGSNRG